MIATRFLSAVALLSLSVKSVHSKVVEHSDLEIQPRYQTPSYVTTTVDAPSTVVVGQPDITPSTIYVNPTPIPSGPQTVSTVYLPSPVTVVQSEPKASLKPETKCKTAYRIAFARFQIWGTNWAPERLNAEGPPGTGLKRQVSACGKVTHWRFKEGKDGYDFFATGHTLIGTKHCIERAMLAAGSGNGQCHGTS